MIKSYKQFLKEGSIGQPQPAPEIEPAHTPEYTPGSIPDNIPGSSDEPSKIETPSSPSKIEIPQTGARYVEEEEEGDDRYMGDEIMSSLSKELGTALEDNKIEYDGRVIDMPSETGNFRVDGIDTKLNKIEDIIKFLEIPPNNKIDREFILNDEDTQEDNMDSELESLSYRRSRHNKRYSK